MKMVFKNSGLISPEISHWFWHSHENVLILGHGGGPEKSIWPML